MGQNPTAASVRSWLVAFSIVLSTGCAVEHEAELLEIREVSAERLESATTLTIVGEGFPVGRTGRLALDGRVRARGRAPARFRHRIPIHSKSSTLVEVPITEELFDAVGGRATFRGDLRISFESPLGGTRVFGTLRGVVLDFAPATRERLAHAPEAVEEGREVAERLGFTLSEDELEQGGLSVAEVDQRSPAGRAGVAPGDRILSMDGLRLHGISDLLPPPGIRTTRIEVLREGMDLPVLLELPLWVAARGPTEQDVAWAVVVGLLMLVLAFGAPTARLTAWLARSREPVDDGTIAWLFGLQTAHGRWAAIGRAVMIVFGVVVTSVAFGAVAAASETLQSRFGVGILLSAALALRLTARLMGEVALGVGLRLVSFFVVGMPLILSVVCVSLLVGTGNLHQIQKAQGGLPWEWLVFRHPIAFILFPVFAATALGRVEPEGVRRGLSPIAARAHLMTVSGLGAALFLGGWNPPDPHMSYAELIGIGAYVAKCWLFIGLGLWARTLGRGSVPVWRWAVPLSLSALAATTLWLSVSVPPRIERMSGPLLVVVSAIVAGYLLLSRARRGPRRAQLHPFI